MDRWRGLWLVAGIYFAELLMAATKQFLLARADPRPAVDLSALSHPRIEPEFVTVVNKKRKFVEVSPAFCKLLGYGEAQLIGRPYDDFTVPRTNDIPTILELFLKTKYMHGIRILGHQRGTKIFVRYEAFVRRDGLYQTHLELLGAGA